MNPNKILAGLSMPPPLLAARIGLETALADALADAGEDTDLVDIYTALAASGEHNKAALAACALELPIKPRLAVAAHLDAISTAWCALHRAERKALIRSKEQPHPEA